MRLRSYVTTDVGKVRTNNEDAFLIVEDEGVYVVADGMGGHTNGEVASRLCVEAIQWAYEDDGFRKEMKRQWRDLREEGTYERPLSEFELKRAVEFANHRIYEAAAADPSLRDMGTTAVAVRRVGSRAYLAWVGDSRIYRWRSDRLEQLSEDHSLANEYVRLELLRREDVGNFRFKNVIVRALGLSEEVEVDARWCNVKVGDRFMLCSDGLSDLVPEDQIEDIMAHASGPEDGCDKLVKLALAYGGVDNITVMCMWAETDEEG